MNLFKTLMLSWLTGVGLTFIYDLDVNYQLKCLSMSVIYLLLAVFCYRYIKSQLKYNKILELYLISALCICMIISSWFNFLFCSYEIYYMFVDIRYNNAFSWKNIYKSVELVALLTVGRNGVIYLYNRIICSRRRLNVIINDNSTYHIGR